jgi:hypothetical protein
MSVKDLVCSKNKKVSIKRAKKVTKEIDKRRVIERERESVCEIFF